MEISKAQILKNAQKLHEEAKGLEKQLMRMEGTPLDNDPRKDCVSVSPLSGKPFWGSIEKKDIVDGNSMFMRASRMNKKGSQETFIYKREEYDYEFYTNEVNYSNKDSKSGKTRYKDMQEIYDGYVVSTDYKEGAGIDTPLEMPVNMS
ncbi:MAG: hypothetical protein HYU63_03965 [Armatimonadetes bacterium]|nr:hypothetical protein [Armatimonadota bacterium]